MPPSEPMSWTEDLAWLKEHTKIHPAVLVCYRLFEHTIKPAGEIAKAAGVRTTDVYSHHRLVKERLRARDATRHRPVSWS